MKKNTRTHNRRRFVILGITLILGGFGGASVSYGVYMKAKAIFAVQLLEGAWSNMLAGKKQVKPWPWADTVPFARLEVPSLGINLIVLEGGSGRTLAFGPGHIDGTGAAGGPGNCAIIGHKDTSFGFLEKLLPSDRIFITSKQGVRYEYRVSFAKPVTSRDGWVYAGTQMPSLTLVTCYPFDSLLPGDGRYIVRAALKQ
jgi:sortase A